MGRLRNRHFLLLDLVLLALAGYLSYVLRLEGFDLGDGAYVATCVVFTLCAIAITPLVFRRMGIYKRWWRYASIDELTALTVATLIAVVFASLASYPIESLLVIPSTPRSIPFIFLMLALAMTAAPRLSMRLFARYRPASMKSSRVLVMGAGDAGANLVRELQSNKSRLSVQVVGFLDDNPAKAGMRIYGIPVLGGHGDIPYLVETQGIDEVIIAMPTASGKVIREVVKICEDAGVKTRIVPGIHQLLDGRVSVNQLRNVEIEDLLRREPVQTDTAAVSELVHGKRVLVTGGGGSIGSELCRQILRFGPEQLIILGHGENSVFEIAHELRAVSHVGTTITTVVADMRFAERMIEVMQHYRPQIVFHTAAHKHVSLMEQNPTEAITNNVVGTRNVLNAALTADVDRFVMISTDKAVNPVSMMGVSKRVGELLVHQAARRSGKPYVAVRFGNVLGSRGSVVLTFKRQIAAGGPVTVTHPDMKRYFMTIPEAVQLVLQAAVLGSGGEVFVLDMGEPIKIVDLARDLIELSGLEVGQDIDIVYTGILPGEKLDEELFVTGETYERTRHQKIFIAANASHAVPDALDSAVDGLHAAAVAGEHTVLMDGLKRLVPEFKPLSRSENASSAVQSTVHPTVVENTPDAHRV